MAHLLYTAIDGSGKPVEGFVEADSAAAARDQLVARGYGAVVLHQEAAIGTNPAQLAGLKPGELQELARLRLAVQQRPGLATVLAAVVRGNRLWLAVDIAIALWGLLANRPWLLAGGLALAAWPFAVAAWKFRHGQRYDALIRHYAAGQWDEVERLARLLRGAAPQSRLDFDLDVRMASIAARRGSLAQAVAQLEPWRARLAASPGLFETRLASVYAAAGDRAGYVRLMEEGHERGGKEPARALDVALAHARYGDAEIAARLLQGLDASLLPPQGAPFLAWADGLVRLRQGQPGALDQLGAALAGFLQRSAQPAVWTSVAFCTCDHAVALANAGRKDEAQRELAEVWPILRAHGDKPLLHMLQAEGLVPH